MGTLVQEKTKQAVEILQEKGIDLWITFVRETTAGGDPVLPLIYGRGLTWQSTLIISKTGEKIAIVGTFEENTAIRTQAYDTVIPYNESIQPLLLDTLNRLNPEKIAINYSESDVYADGLGHGLFKVLTGYLSGTPFADRLVSAEPIISALRGRKTPAELALIKQAIQSTKEIYASTFQRVKAGMSEGEIAAIMHEEVEQRGLTTSWEWDHCPTVNAGKDSPVGHVSPTEIILKPGDLLHFDFGVTENAYCSDIQRLAFLPSEDQPLPGEKLTHAFQTIVRAIEKSVEAIKPGVAGKDIDAIARATLEEAGYPAFQHALGHQVGRQAHDGGGIIGPLWERYGDTPNWPLEAGQVYTIEPSIIHPDVGVVALEEMILVTETRAEFISEPQKELIILNP
ncbi:MAG: M24 family metallopeptidase [Anaerolineales bacterium]